jgi:hypothetical protein
LKLGKLYERVVEVGRVFNLKEGVGEQPCLAPVEPNHIDRLGALAQRIVGEAGKLLHRDLCAQRLAQKRLAPIGFRRENLVAAQFANHQRKPLIVGVVERRLLLFGSCRADLEAVQDAVALRRQPPQSRAYSEEARIHLQDAAHSGEGRFCAPVLGRDALVEVSKRGITA